MRTLVEPGELRLALARSRQDGLRVALVPTMGALHAGHLALVAEARRRADVVVVSIFVNPTQFNAAKDFSRYPRQLGADSTLLEDGGCDFLFAPEADALYPPGHATWVVPGGVADGLEGTFRPGHFRGVATIVTILLHIVEPAIALFGEKDAQQLALVRQMVRDLAMPVEIVGVPTVREDDGLAMSSRNVHLSPLERRAATVLHRSLERAAAAIAAGERRGGEVRQLLADTLATEPVVAVEYAEVVDAGTFQPIEALHGRIVLPLAARVGTTRLIDNLQLEVDEATG
jgi:pantoate--beta-alanine ligase